MQDYVRFALLGATGPRVAVHELGDGVTRGRRTYPVAMDEHPDLRVFHRNQTGDEHEMTFVRNLGHMISPRTGEKLEGIFPQFHCAVDHHEVWISRPINTPGERLR